ncbi:hypothetical protein [Rhizobium sp. AC27/96]|uniref:hypothetical protein n=1 Tax=Rhizobium sp. AC27/96 TaxID=1841653 RepID=UPI0034E05CDF
MLPDLSIPRKRTSILSASATSDRFLAINRTWDNNLHNSIKYLAILTGLVSTVIAVLVSSISQKSVNLEVLNISLKIIGTLSSGFVISSVIINIGWKRFRWIQSLLGIPDYSGRWIGWYRSTANGEWYPTAHEIIQRSPFKISATAWGPRNRSTSVTCTLGQGADEGLIWTYQTRRVEHPVEQGGDHRGIHIMRLIRFRDSMEGFYINDRVRTEPNYQRGATGEISLIFNGEQLRNQLEYNEKNWPPNPSPP